MTDEDPAERVVPADSGAARALLHDGWSLRWRSFGASLPTDAVSIARLNGFIDRIPQNLRLRPLTDQDIQATVDLSAETAGDYPRGPATRPQPLSLQTATTTDQRVGFGAFDKSGDLIAITFMDVLPDGIVETDFTVVAPCCRGRGVAAALKAYSVLQMAESGVREFRTGGASENAAIWAVNRALGYEIDEEWVTFTRP